MPARAGRSTRSMSGLWRTLSRCGLIHTVSGMRTLLTLLVALSCWSGEEPLLHVRDVIALDGRVQQDIAYVLNDAELITMIAGLNQVKARHDPPPRQRGMVENYFIVQDRQGRELLRIVGFEKPYVTFGTKSFQIPQQTQSALYDKLFSPKTNFKVAFDRLGVVRVVVGKEPRDEDFQYVSDQRLLQKSIALIERLRKRTTREQGPLTPGTTYLRIWDQSGGSEFNTVQIQYPIVGLAGDGGIIESTPEELVLARDILLLSGIKTVRPLPVVD